MLRVSIIVEIREIGPNGPGRCAIGFSRFSTESLVPKKQWADRFFDALRRATLDRAKNLEEVRQVAGRQKDLFAHKPEPF